MGRQHAKVIAILLPHILVLKALLRIHTRQDTPLEVARQGALLWSQRS